MIESNSFLCSVLPLGDMHFGKTAFKNKFNMTDHTIMFKSMYLKNYTLPYQSEGEYY